MATTAVETAPLSSLGLSSSGHRKHKHNTLLLTPTGSNHQEGFGVSGGDDHDNDAVALGEEVSELQVEVASMRAALAGKERVMAEQGREVERLRHLEREFGRHQDKATEVTHKYRELKGAYREQHAKLSTQLDSCARLKAQLRACQEEGAAASEESEMKVQALTEEFAGRMGDLRDALGREGRLVVELDQEKRESSSEKARLRHELKEEGSKREGLARRLGEELAKSKRLEGKVMMITMRPEDGWMSDG